MSCTARRNRLGHVLRNRAEIHGQHVHEHLSDAFSEALGAAFSEAFGTERLCGGHLRSPLRPGTSRPNEALSQPGAAGRHMSPRDDLLILHPTSVDYVSFDIDSGR